MTRQVSVPSDYCRGTSGSPNKKGPVLMLLDIRYALRRFRREVGFTLAAVLVIAMAVGASTTVFSLVDSLLLGDLPGVGQPQRLVEVGRTQRGEGMDTESYPDYRDYRDRNSSFEELAAWSMASLNFSPKGEALRIHGAVASGNYFSTLGASPQLGRFFAAAEDATPGTHPVVVLSDAFWRRSMAGSQDAVGSEVTINGQSFTVIGVAQPDFVGTVTPFHPDVWLPMMMKKVAIPVASDAASRVDMLESRGSNWLMLFGRLRPGVTIDQAKSDLNTIAAALEEAFPRSNRSQRVEIQLLGKLPATARLPVAVFTGLLFAATGALLLIACVNVAGLSLARLSGRRDELAVRMAVGCGHWRLTCQLLTETVLLFSAAGLIGLVFAFSFERLLQAFQPPAPFPLHVNGSWDYPVFVFALLLSLVCGLLFGVFPARFATREALGTLLRKQTAGSRKLSRLRKRFRSGTGLPLPALVVHGRAFPAVVAADSADRSGIRSGKRMDWPHRPVAQSLFRLPRTTILQVVSRAHSGTSWNPICSACCRPAAGWKQNGSRRDRRRQPGVFQGGKLQPGLTRILRDAEDSDTGWPVFFPI